MGREFNQGVWLSDEEAEQEDISGSFRPQTERFTCNSPSYRLQFVFPFLYYI